MLSVTVNFEAKERAQYRTSVYSRESYIKVFLLVAGATLIVLAPLLGWFVWHRQWLALAALGCWVLYLWRTLDVRRQRSLDDLLSEQGHATYTLLPDGLLVTAKQDRYTYRAWPQLEMPVKNSSGLIFNYAGQNSYFFIPRASFANAAEFEAFATQAIRFHTAVNPATANVLPNIREPESNPRYVLRYQPPNEVINVTDAFPELKMQFPHTFPQEKEMPKWKAYLIGLLLLGTFTIFINPFDDQVDSKYSRGTMLLFVMYFGYLWLLFKAFLWIQPRWTKSASRPLSEFVLTLCEHRLRCTQPGEEYAKSWNDYDAVVHHGGKITLWRRAILQDIIPDFAFATPEEARDCADWILQKITQNNVPLPVADLADNKLFPPDTGNPYQAPRHS